MKWATFLLIFLSVSPTFAAEKVTPITPRKPVEVSVVIGTLPGSSHKVEVELRGVVKREEVVYRVVIRGERYVEIPLADARPLAVALEKLADGMRAGDEVSVGDVTVVVGKYKDGDRYVSVRAKEGFGGGETLDADGAGMLAQALLQADGVAAWITPRAEGLRERR